MADWTALKWQAILKAVLVAYTCPWAAWFLIQPAALLQFLMASMGGAWLLRHIAHSQPFRYEKASHATRWLYQQVTVPEAGRVSE